MEALGIKDFDALDQHPPNEIAELLRTRRVSVSPAQVHGWSEHARSYREGRAVMFGPPPPVGESFIALDLEYDEIANVWLTAVLICDGDWVEHNYFWADKRREEREALLALEAIYETYPDLPVVTWAGVSADMPKLRDAAARHRLSHIADSVEARHVDLFQYAAKTLRVPHPELSLKAVAEYFGVARVSQISDGLAAQMLYDQYRGHRDPDKRARLQADLIAYNRDDLEATAAMARIMLAGPAGWPAARTNGWEEHRALNTPPPRRLRPRDPSEPDFRERARLRHLARVGQSLPSSPSRPDRQPAFLTGEPPVPPVARSQDRPPGVENGSALDLIVAVMLVTAVPRTSPRSRCLPPRLPRTAMSTCASPNQRSGWCSRTCRCWRVHSR